jgi:hypothetical protein
VPINVLLTRHEPFALGLLALMTRFVAFGLLCSLPRPATINGLLDDTEVGTLYRANETDLDIVLDGHEFGVADAGLLHQFLLDGHLLHGHRAESKWLLAWQWRGRLPAMPIHHPVFGFSDPRLRAASAFVRQDRSRNLSVDKVRIDRSRWVIYTQVLWPESVATTMNLRMPV